MPTLTSNDTDRFIRIAHRSDQEHDVPLTWNGQPLPCLHLNPRSRTITSAEIAEIYLAEVNK